MILTHNPEGKYDPRWTDGLTEDVPDPHSTEAWRSKNSSKPPAGPGLASGKSVKKRFPSGRGSREPAKPEHQGGTEAGARPLHPQPRAPLNSSVHDGQPSVDADSHRPTRQLAKKKTFLSKKQTITKQPCRANGWNIFNFEGLKLSLTRISLSIVYQDRSFY